MKKVAIFAFNGELMCFAHALFNVIDMKEKGYDVKLIIEGASCKLIKDLNDEKNPFNKLYNKVKELGILEGICKACSSKLGTLEEAKLQNLNLLGELLGHPAMSTYINEGYEIITI